MQNSHEYVRCSETNVRKSVTKCPAHDVDLLIFLRRVFANVGQMCLDVTGPTRLINLINLTLVTPHFLTNAVKTTCSDMLLQGR